MGWFWDWLLEETEEGDDDMAHKKPKEDTRYPQRGDNNGHHDRLCKLECEVEEQAKQLVATTREIAKLKRQGVNIMGELQDVKNAIAQVKTDLANEKVEVAAEIQKLKDQIAAGSPVTSQDLDDLITSVNEIGSGVKDIFTP